MLEVKLGSWVKIKRTQLTGVVVHIYQPPPDSYIDDADIRMVVHTSPQTQAVHRKGNLTVLTHEERTLKAGAPYLHDVPGLDAIGEDSPLNGYVFAAALIQRDELLDGMEDDRRADKQTVIRIRTQVDWIMDNQAWKTSMEKACLDIENQLKRLKTRLDRAAARSAKLVALRNYIERAAKAGY